MGSGLLPDLALGSHTIEVANTSSGTTFFVSSSDGPVILSGGGSIGRNGTPLIEILASTAPAYSANTALPALLGLMGQEVKPGTFRLKLP